MAGRLAPRCGMSVDGPIPHPAPRGFGGRRRPHLAARVKWVTVEVWATRGDMALRRCSALSRFEILSARGMGDIMQCAVGGSLGGLA